MAAKVQKSWHKTKGKSFKFKLYLFFLLTLLNNYWLEGA